MLERDSDDDFRPIDPTILKVHPTNQRHCYAMYSTV